jgi:hypothetical protein
MKFPIVWDVTSCSLVEVHRCFGGMYFFHFHVQSIMKPASRRAPASTLLPVGLLEANLSLHEHLHPTDFYPEEGGNIFAKHRLVQRRRESRVSMSSELQSLEAVTSALSNSFPREASSGRRQDVTRRRASGASPRLWERWRVKVVCGPGQPLRGAEIALLPLFFCFLFTSLSFLSLHNRGIGVRFPGGARDFCPLDTVYTGSGAHPASYLMGTGFFRGSKAAGT